MDDLRWNHTETGVLVGDGAADVRTRFWRIREQMASLRCADIYPLSYSLLARLLR